jgi:hypothetical protein
MAEIQIPHAAKLFVDVDPPRKILHVVTHLPATPSAPGFDAAARHHMLVAVSKMVADNGLDGYYVHWSDDPDATTV